MEGLSLASMRSASALPEAERWRRAMKERAAAQAAQEELQKDAILRQASTLASLSASARQSEEMSELASRRAQDREVEAMRRINEIKWVSVQAETELEERIRSLEAFLDADRRARAEEALQHMELIRQLQEEAQARVLEAERRSVDAVAAADIRVQEAEDRAAAAVRRADQEIAAARIEAEDRVRTIRERADAQVRACKEQSRFELEQMHWTVVQRQRALEEGLYPNGRPSSEVFTQVRRHGAVIEQGMKELHLAREAEMARKVQEPHAVAQHEASMLELEKALHARTLDRAAERVSSQLKGGDTGFQRFVTSSTAASPRGESAVRSPETAGSTLSRAGCALVTE